MYPFKLNLIYFSRESNTGPLQTFAEKAKMDNEYMSLMAELGVDAPPAKKPPPSLPVSFMQPIMSQNTEKINTGFFLSVGGIKIKGFP